MELDKAILKWKPIIDTQFSENEITETQINNLCFICHKFNRIFKNLNIITKIDTLPIILRSIFKLIKSKNIEFIYCDEIDCDFIDDVLCELDINIDTNYDYFLNLLEEMIDINLCKMFNDCKTVYISDIVRTVSLTNTETTRLRYKLEKQTTMEETKEQVTNFQQCAQLDVEDKYTELRNEGGDALSLIFNMQKSIQEDVYGHDFDKIRSSIGSLKAFIDIQEEAYRDEDREMIAALTGIHTYPNCWKPWKSKHKEAMERPLSALTEDELKELHMEWIDKLHFFICEGISLGLDSQLVTNYYVSKNKENVKRQQKLGGY